MLSLTQILAELTNAGTLALNAERLGVSLHRQLSALFKLSATVKLTVESVKLEKDLLFLSGTMTVLRKTKPVPATLVLLDLPEERHGMLLLELAAGTDFLNTFKYKTGETFTSEHLEAIHFDRDNADGGGNLVLFSSLPAGTSAQPYITDYFSTSAFTAEAVKQGINVPLKVQISETLPGFAQSIFGDAVDSAVDAALSPVVGQIYLKEDDSIGLRVATGVGVTAFSGDNFEFQPFALELVAPMNGDNTDPLFIVASRLKLGTRLYGFAGEVDPTTKTLRLQPELAGSSPLADWIGGNGGLDQFPEPLLSLISPERLGVSVLLDLEAKEVSRFDLAYAPATVTLLNDSIGLTPDLEIGVESPFGGDARAISWAMAGGGNIEEQLLVEASMAWPEPVLNLEMTEPVAARYLLTPFFGDIVVPGAETLTLETMTMAYTPESNDFDITTALADGGDWGYNIGDFRLGLTAIQLNALREAGASTYGLAAMTEIGGVALAMTGTHALETGWDFRIITQEAIIIDQWLFEISSGNFSLPDGLNDFSITSLDFAYQPKSKAFALDVAASNVFSIPLGNGNSIDLGELGLSMQRDTQTEATLRGTTELDFGDGDNFAFAVQLDYLSPPSPPSSPSSAPAAAPENAQWLLDARSTGPLPMGQLISWLADKFSLSDDDANLPDSVKDLTLSNLYFTADTDAKQYRFGGQSDFTLADLPGSIEISLEVSADEDDNYSTTLRGNLLLVAGNDDLHQFDLIFNKSRSTQRADVMLARYAGELNLQRVVSLFAEDAAQNIPAWLSPQTDEVMFLLVKKSSGYDMLFSLDIDLTGEEKISLRQLEFIGRFIPPGEDELGVKMNILFSDKAATRNDTKIYNQVVEGMGFSSPFKHGGQRLKKGLTVTTEITAPLLGDDLVLPITGDAAPAGEAAPSKTAWKPVRKKLGPVFIEKAGITMEDGKVKILLDGGMQMGPFEFQLLGFGIKVPLKTDLNPLTDIDFGLDGLELDIRKGKVNISGGFFRQVIPVNGRNYTGYAGQIRASIGPKSLTAFGGYVDIGGTPSFFLYAVALLPLGGAPEFFIDGFAGGFGLNSSLNIPPIEGVRNFIMVKSAFGESSFDEGGQGSGLSQIFEDIPPAIGRHWIAIGIKANHYKFIESFMLVAVTFGDRIELELLGLARLKMPKGAEKLVRAELAIHAHVIPAEGTVGIDARITDGSYVINPMARLSGGFAFYTWFAGEHAGDFVITLGGYNSKFKKPAHYPSVPRLALAYQVTRNIYIKGSAYFALTPKMLMMGGRLEGTADLGVISAWFVVNADFTMNFQPYQYLIESDVTIGATFTLDLLLVTIRKTIQIGAEMKIWGPEFGGKATVDLAIVEFTIEFGKKRALPAPISWGVCKKDLQPPEENLNRISIAKGIVRELKGEAFGPDNVRFIVNPADLEVVIESIIPAEDITLDYLDKQDTESVSNWTLGIGPMRISSSQFHPKLNVKFTKHGDAGEQGEFTKSFTRGNAPAALWGGFMDRNINGPRLLGTETNTAPFKGLSFVPAKDESADVLGPLDLREVLMPVSEDLAALRDAYPPVPQASMGDDAVKPLHEILTRPDAGLLTELSALATFDHLPHTGEITFNTSDTVSEVDTFEFEDTPVLCTLGANNAGTSLTTNTLA